MIYDPCYFPAVNIKSIWMLGGMKRRPVSDNRASLLRSAAAVKRPVNERDVYLHLWKNYVAFACRVVPPSGSAVLRCASPDISLRFLIRSHPPVNSIHIHLFEMWESHSIRIRLKSALNQLKPKRIQFEFHWRVTRMDGSDVNTGGGGNVWVFYPSNPIGWLIVSSSSPDGVLSEKSDARMSTVGAVSPSSLYKLIVPLLRCEVTNMRNTVVRALGMINYAGLR